jgi:hypothetical protein
MMTSDPAECRFRGGTAGTGGTALIAMEKSGPGIAIPRGTGGTAGMAGPTRPTWRAGDGTGKGV